jgi:hypothetical protein
LTSFPANRKIKTAKEIIPSAVWRSASIHLQIHDFAPPPHDGFAFSMHIHYISSAEKGKYAVTFWSTTPRLTKNMTRGKWKSYKIIAVHAGNQSIAGMLSNDCSEYTK